MSLRPNYRDRIKGLCLARSLFSGDGRTGGINLNVCALITNVVAGNWLKEDGVLGFLMPDTLLYQNTYRGFRQLQVLQGVAARFIELHDWTAAGKPFAPVSQNFFTYFIGTSSDSDVGAVPVVRFRKKANDKRAAPQVLPLADYHHEISFGAIRHVFDEQEWVASPISNDVRKGFALSPVDSVDAALFHEVAGTCAYRGRQGLEFYPKDVYMLSFKKQTGGGKAIFSKKSSKTDSFVLETSLMFPLIEGSKLAKFGTSTADFFVPFPYDEGERAPISSRSDDGGSESLAQRASEMMEYFQRHQGALKSQSAHNGKIIGEENNTEFYAVPRVGAYTFGEHFVAFRDNTKWGACVVSSQATPWGAEKRPLFQKHAVTISLRPDGTFISLDEAHYVCAVMNSPIVERFILASNDKRSFKIKLPFKIPLFDGADTRHRKLASLSKIAHDIVAQNVVAPDNGFASAVLYVVGLRSENLYLDVLRVPNGVDADFLDYEEEAFRREVLEEATFGLAE